MVLAIFGHPYNWDSSRWMFRQLRSIRNVIKRAGLVRLYPSHYVRIEEQSFTSIYQKGFADLRSATDWLVYKHCSGEVYYYIFIANITVDVWSKCDFCIYTWCWHGAKIRPTIGDKIVHTLYSNRVTSENKRIRAPSLSPQFKVGVFVVSYRKLEHRHNLAWRGWGRKSYFSPFWI